MSEKLNDKKTVDNQKILKLEREWPRRLAGSLAVLLFIWFIGGVQVFAIGILGEYIGKIYTEVKHRPNYHIEKTI